METKNCKECDAELTEHEIIYNVHWCDDCNEPPEGYIKPGSEAKMWVNAYEVTRHYGGPEEGGWFFNHSNPLASIPILAESIAGHDTSCGRCNDSRERRLENGKPIQLCKWGFHLMPKNQLTVDMMKQYLQEVFGNIVEGNIYSVNGGVELIICLEDEVGKPTEPQHYE